MQWSRPNHMPSHLDALQTPTPVNLRRFPCDFHSVAKQASFRIAFWRDFNRFWEGFGGQNGARNRILGGFFALFFSSTFGNRFFGDFSRFLKVRTLIFVSTASVSEHFRKIDVFEKVAKNHGFLLRFRRPKLRKIDKNLC